MIGGTDIILNARNVQAAMDMAIRVIRLAWDQAVFEDADTGQTFRSYSEIDLRARPEILVYRDQKAQSDWKEIGPDPSVEGTMIHLIGRRGELTIGLDDEPTPAILSIVDVIRRSLRAQPELFAAAAASAAAAAVKGAE